MSVLLRNGPKRGSPLKDIFFASRRNLGRISGAQPSAWRMAPLSQVSAIFVPSFYSSLFSAEPTDPGEQNYLFQQLESTLPDEASSSCDGPLSEDELLAAVPGMARGKATWLDGLSFWHLLAPDLLTVLNFSFRGASSHLFTFRHYYFVVKKGRPFKPRKLAPDNPVKY